MLTNKETFDILQSIDRLIELKARKISKDSKLEKDDIKSIISMTSFDMFKRHYDKNKCRPCNFFIKFCMPRSKQVLIRETNLIKIPYGEIEKRNANKYSFISLDLIVNENEDSDLYNYYAKYDDPFIDNYDNKQYILDQYNDIMQNVYLTKDEKITIKKLFGIGRKEKTAHEIGEEIGKTYQCIYKRKNNAFNKIREYVKSKGEIYD